MFTSRASRWGTTIGQEHPIEADMVVPVPDNGNYAALGYSLESSSPHWPFVRNHYVGRSFLQPSQVTRSMDVRVKLNLVPNLVEGKRIIIVDDSIVRGTTSQSRIKILQGGWCQGGACVDQYPPTFLRLWH